MDDVVRDCFPLLYFPPHFKEIPVAYPSKLELVQSYTASLLPFMCKYISQLSHPSNSNCSWVYRYQIQCSFCDCHTSLWVNTVGPTKFKLLWFVVLSYLNFLSGHIQNPAELEGQSSRVIFGRIKLGPLYVFKSFQNDTDNQKGALRFELFMISCMLSFYVSSFESSTKSSRRNQ